MKKALIVSPYLDHLGGGERYMLTAAQALEKMGYEIYFSWDNLSEINHLASMLGLTLVSPRLDPTIISLYHSSNPWGMYRSTSAYDLVFYLSDGSLPILGGKQNFVHMQVPFHGVGGSSLKNKLKRMFLNQIIVNSQFTKKVVDHEYGINSSVLYPPVVNIEKKSVKEKIILSVGRFEPSLNTKHQEILIDAFRLLSPNMPGWKLVLSGATSSPDWIANLRTRAHDLPIEFALNLSYDELTEMYSKSTLYWHAAGYQVDENKNPELTEHFGITTVEAISAGCIPLVVPVGGQREIVADEIYHWSSIPQLIEKTKLVLSRPDLPKIEIERYSQANFESQFSLIINNKHP